VLVRDISEEGSRPPTGQRPFHVRRRISALTGALIGIAAALAAADFGHFVAMVEDREPRSIGPADGIVALTGGAERIPDAVNLLADGRARRLLITGVNQATSESALSDVTPDTARLLSCCIDLDRNALNTVGNALEAARWVRLNGFKSIIVVTSSYHMPRSLMELERVLPDTELIAYPVVSSRLKINRWWQDPGTIRILVFEYAKYRGAVLKLRFDPPTAGTVQAALD
jgi:uncharacterized SAM-binding protein YcdF (DUF218 family)